MNDPLEVCRDAETTSNPNSGCGAEPEFKPGLASKSECSLGSESGSATDAELAALAKALGHPARVKILRYLAARSSCVCGDVVEEVALAQSTVSQHLKVLKDAGLIRGEIDPPRVCYCLDPAVVRRFQNLVASLL